MRINERLSFRCTEEELIRAAEKALGLRNLVINEDAAGLIQAMLAQIPSNTVDDPGYPDAQYVVKNVNVRCHKDHITVQLETTVEERVNTKFTLVVQALQKQILGDKD